MASINARCDCMMCTSILKYGRHGRKDLCLDIEMKRIFKRTGQQSMNIYAWDLSVSALRRFFDRKCVCDSEAAARRIWPGFVSSPTRFLPVSSKRTRSHSPGRSPRTGQRGLADRIASLQLQLQQAIVSSACIRGAGVEQLRAWSSGFPRMARCVDS